MYSGCVGVQEDVEGARDELEGQRELSKGAGRPHAAKCTTSDRSSPDRPVVHLARVTRCHVPSVRRAFPPVGWQKTVEQEPQRTTNGLTRALTLRRSSLQVKKLPRLEQPPSPFAADAPRPPAHRRARPSSPKLPNSLNSAVFPIADPDNV